MNYYLDHITPTMTFKWLSVVDIEAPGSKLISSQRLDDKNNAMIIIKS